MSTKPYVGRSRKTGKLEVFRADKTPTDASHGHLYTYAIGPFRTARGARVMVDGGENNPHIVTVGDAERIAARR